jgi:hypothetical protein
MADRTEIPMGHADRAGQMGRMSAKNLAGGLLSGGASRKISEDTGRRTGWMFGQLIPLGGGDPIPLLKQKLLIGRRSSCDITLEFPNVSSHHCELEMKNGYWHVRDLGSSNGTKVNGERVLEHFLQPGDTIAIAKHRFEVQYTPDPDAPPPEEEDPFAKSLLEKAGITRGDRSSERSRPRRSAPPTPPPPPVAKPLPAKAPEEMDDDDRALDFLMHGE